MQETDTREEIKRIEEFLRETLEKSGMNRVLIGLSGGIDSSTSLALAVRALNKEQIHVLLMPNSEAHPQALAYARDVLQFLGIPGSQVEMIDIAQSTQALMRSLGIDSSDKIRSGNIMARVRMICLFDRAKKHDALVLGTENKSEHLLGYYTRGGDELSDIEPIRHLYKTQVYTVARVLGLPSHILEQAPTAGLWHGQTDESELGFTYEEADRVLFGYLEDNASVEELVQQGFSNAEKILRRMKEVSYKHHVPYSLDAADEL